MSRPAVLTLCLCLAALFSAPASSRAEDQDAEPRIDCDNAVSTVEMNFCGEKELEKADAALNAAYKNAIAGIPELASEKPYDTKSWEEALRASQRAWVAFRDAECKDHVPMFWTGGTGATGEVLGCMTEMTKNRTVQLKELYEPD
jgi:uncharacterized protein YecT (DUF1311 family)